MKSRLLLAVVLILCDCLMFLTVAAQESATAPAVVAASDAVANVVPNLVNYSGVLKDASGRVLTGVSGVTFLLYSSEHGGAPLWLETQSVTPDKAGHYTVQLGAASKNGIPSDLFVSGEGRWLAVQIGNEAEQPRVLLVAVPYAMKAVDAQTLGGLPASAFVLAAPPTSAAASANPGTAAAASSSASTLPAPASTVTTNGGTANTISMFTGTTTIGNAIMTQTGTTAINVNGKLNLPAIGTATAAAGFNSRPLDFVASVFNSATAKPVAQTFQWQAEPVNNDKTTAGGTLNLLYATGTGVPAETGLKINNKGLFTFASGQTFPGTGPGTVKSVGLSAPAADFTVSGSPVTGSGTLALGWKVVPTNVDTPNAIVKRDGTGSFNVTNITGSGTFSTVTANPIAIQGTSSLSGGVGVHGSATAAASGASAGVLGDSVSTAFLSSGVQGNDGNTSGSHGVTLGVLGHSNNPLGIGVLGFDGVNGLSNLFLTTAGGQRVGVWGDAQGGSGQLEAIGVAGKSDTGVGVWAENGTGSCCAALVALGGTSASAQGATGLPGIASNAGNGDPNNNTNGGDGVIANGGNSGGNGNGGNGVTGQGGSGGNGNGGNGVTGQGGSGGNGNGGNGVIGQGGSGANGDGGNGVTGQGGTSTGFLVSAGAGGQFTGGTFIQSAGGMCTGGHCGGDGIVAVGGFDNNNQNQGFAGHFQGDLLVAGTINKSALGFQIDHPLDPANKYLHHSGVESPDMMNISRMVRDSEPRLPLPTYRPGGPST